ncbi:hypothetical protein [Roseimaritima ulvae]|uniref:Uncharacterized protein n=1 Tax=Roseimaritima ulvae TaxID=980254 RepID=A0A5B9R542_9BACT|nr:hypothetical protein [Roseimaritima ulvae]QEG41343.1 hypothetical protein UC8_33620 [Roseimaritima ulvae]
MSFEDWQESFADERPDPESIFVTWPRVLTLAKCSARISAALSHDDFDATEVRRLAQNILAIGTFGIDAREGPETVDLPGAGEALQAIGDALRAARSTTNEFLWESQSKEGVAKIAMESQHWRSRFESMNGLLVKAWETIMTIDEISRSVSKDTLDACDLYSEESREQDTEELQSPSGKLPATAWRLTPIVEPFEEFHDRMAKPGVTRRDIANAWLKSRSGPDRTRLINERDGREGVLKYFMKKCSNLRAKRIREAKKAISK